MSTHAALEAKLVALVSAGVGPNVPVAVTVDPRQLAGLGVPAVVSVEWESRRLAESEELGAAGVQAEIWVWRIYVLTGGGVDASDQRSAAFDLFAALQSALFGQRLDGYCDQLELLSEEFYGYTEAGVVYMQRWQHTRWEG